MNEVVLYRKYRPKSFDEILGQDHVVKVLQNAIELNRIAHAYLFAGPRGTGKTTMARILARSAVCSAQKSKPCNACDMCKDFLAGNAFDLVEIDAASSRGIDEIRALRDAVGLMPLKSPYKTYIIDEVHMLTKEAFNALLKTLEEPPAHAIFILATTELIKVPETIISRCQKFDFRKIPEQVIQESLHRIAKKEGVAIDQEAVNLLALFADGSFRDAQGMLGQVIAKNGTNVAGEEVRILFGAPKSEMVRNMVDAVIAKDAGRAIGIIQTLIKDNIDSHVFLKFLLRDFRHIFLLKISPEYERILSQSIKGDSLDFLKKYSNNAGQKECEYILSVLLNAYNARRLTYLPHLPLEIAVVKAAMR